MLKNLRDFMYMRELTSDRIAGAIGMTVRTFEAKLAESIPFTLDEAKAIRDEFFPGSSLDGPFGVFESDGDVPTEREKELASLDALEGILDDVEADPALYESLEAMRSEMLSGKSEAS